MQGTTVNHAYKIYEAVPTASICIYAGRDHAVMQVLATVGYESWSHYFKAWLIRSNLSSSVRVVQRKKTTTGGVGRLILRGVQYKSRCVYFM